MAVRDGDEWIVTGQKVWTSGAHYSDWAILLTRTIPRAQASRHHVFLVDMRTPGIDVRPLRQITGAAHFTGCFLSDGPHPPREIVARSMPGGSDDDHAVERAHAHRGGQGRTGIGDLISPPATRGPTTMPSSAGVGQGLHPHADPDLSRYRVRTAACEATAGPESSVMKLAVSCISMRSATWSWRCKGRQDCPARARSTTSLAMEFPSVGARIGGGTDQIQRKPSARRCCGCLPNRGSTRESISRHPGDFVTGERGDGTCVM